MHTYRNPILPGFHPDPSVTKVGNEYFLVTSSFQWFPGIPIFRSGDLVHWKPAGYALTRRSQLDLDGIPDSLGVWAPDIQYFDGIFYIAYTDMRHYNKRDRRDKLIENKLITATDPAGPWSDPATVNGSGIDPSLFRDDDGRFYWINQVYGPDTFSMGIACQEIDPQTGALLGEARVLWPGTEAGYTEGPHLYKRNGWYYLLTAEGGTFHNHQCSLARSRNLRGPYETIPGDSILTMRDSWRETGISRSGHGDFIEVDGDMRYIVFLAARPFGGGDQANLGRETFLLPVKWSPEGWPVVNGGRGVTFESLFPPLTESEPYTPPVRADFDTPELPGEFNFCRNPEESGFSLSERPGFLRIRGSAFDLSDLAHENLIARRQEHITFTAAALIDFQPADDRAEAGLTCYYDTRNYYKLGITRSGGQRIARLTRHRTDPGPEKSEVASDTVLGEFPLSESGPVELRVAVREQNYQFLAGPEGMLQPVGAPVWGGILSDEHAMTFSWGFTGAFAGVYTVDRSGEGAAADFDWFEYEGK
ncbi:MAG: family 43 glycosylhydrolase [Candidatus Latescibacterota bacterium]